MAHIVVVGAGGFIGGALAARLAESGAEIRAVTRRPANLPSGVPAIALGTLASSTDWTALFEGARSVVHLASGPNPTAAAAISPDWEETEVAAARHLARSAAASGVPQLLLVSSAKVHGEDTRPGNPLTSDSPLAPADSYAVVKLRTEQAMADAVQRSGTALAVIRPPLVYGPGVKGNFRAILHLVRRAPVLPFASIANRRSLVYLGNLVDLVMAVLRRAAPVRGSFLARDDEDLSTPELIRRIGRHLGRTPILLPCPAALLTLGARALGQRAAIDRLTQSLQLDDHATRSALGWTPPLAVDRGLAETCRWFLDWERDR